jgi:aminoglycoside 6'-N-acetyltransferase I
MISIERCEGTAPEGLVDLLQLLWPWTEQEHRAEAERMLSDPERFAIFVARADSGALVGFAEASIRRDFVNGCETSPVLFLEGIYVGVSHRRRGIARRLSEAAASWGRLRGCSEFASDAFIENIDSYNVHRALGFAETERVVYFRKLLT